MLRRFAAPGLLAFSLLMSAPTAHAADTVELIVQRDAGLTAVERADIRADAGVDYARSLRLPNTELVSVPAGEAAQALRELRADPDVRSVARDRVAAPAAVTGADPQWGNLWGLENTGQNMSVIGGTGYHPGGTADADMDIPEAWAMNPGDGRGVLVGVLDSGVPANHPDLAGQIDPRGWDFVHGDASTIDNYGHGTHVTGTIVAVNGNGVGISGVAPRATSLQVQVFADDDGDGRTTSSFSMIMDALDYAGDQGARVVNASLGGLGDSYLAQQVADVVGQHPDTLYVVAAGNDDRDLEPAETVYLPCETPAPNVVCVGATSTNDQRAIFSALAYPPSASNYGPTAVDLFAPGQLVLSTTMDGSYGYKQGTSMATPNTAGVAALMLSRNPTLTAEQVKTAMMSSVDAAPGLPSVTGGRVNAQRALASVTADRDGDGSADSSDNCPAVPNPGQENSDGDQFGDACDSDGDSDGIIDSADNCPATANPGQADADHDETGDACDATPRGADTDGDGVGSLDDNCPGASNPGQADGDHDGTGDACDATPRGPDYDGDGVGAVDDNCLWVSNADQADLDHDGQGDVCDSDDDGDGQVDSDDNCPIAANPGQADADHDGTGDACDATPRGDDSDGDGVPAADDNCPTVANPGQADGDGDGIGDACDSAPSDGDDDGVDDAGDNCPAAANPGQQDADRDGTGDACDATPRGADHDGDGIPALDDQCPASPGPQFNRGCPPPPPTPPPTPPADRDGDGISDALDACPTVYGVAEFRGCPTPPTPPTGPGPQPPTGDGGGGSAATSARVTQIAASGHAGKVTVRVKTSGPGTVRVTAERNVCRAGKCAWKTVLSATAAAGGQAKLRLAAGRYRLRAVAGSGPARYRAITVRR